MRVFRINLWKNLRKPGILSAPGRKGKRKAHLDAPGFPFWGDFQGQPQVANPGAPDAIMKDWSRCAGDHRGDGLSCAICHERKEKRFCPAVHDRICPICCGTEREVTLDCPSECPYLQQARKHENAAHLEQIDREALMPQIEVPDSFLYEREPLLGGMSFAIAQAARRDRGVYDRDVISALGAMAKTYETQVNSGLIYEQPTQSPAQHAIAAEISRMLQEMRKVEEQNRGYSTLKDSEVLKALVFSLRLALGRTSGRPKSKAFLDFLFANFPEKPVEGAQEGSRIIVP